MPRLYLRIYLALVGSLLVFAGTAALLWHRAGGPIDQASETLERMLRNSLPAADAPVEEQGAALRRLVAGMKGSYTLLAPDHTPIAAIGPPLTLPADIDAHPDWAHGRAHGSTWTFRLADGRWVLASAPSGSGNSLLAVLQTLFLLAVAVAVGAYPVVRYVTRRLERLQRAADSLAAGDLSVRVGVEGRDEVAKLATSFNRAADRIEHLVGAHKDLLAQASHELRTPLTRIRLAVELMKESADPKRKAGLESDIAELDRLVDEILLASRLDAVSEGDAIEDVDLLALVAEECARYEAAELEGVAVHVRGDPRLLRRLVRNLLENAQRHGRPPVHVTLSAQQGQAQLSVRDAGATIPPERQARLFEPFYRHADTGGAGLGLALVRQIARRHGGDVDYVALADGRHGFRVTLPLPDAG